MSETGVCHDEPESKKKKKTVQGMETDYPVKKNWGRNDQ